MLLPYTADVPMRRLPVANWVVIGLTVAGTINQLGYTLTAPANNVAKGQPVPANVDWVWRILVAAPAGPLALHRDGLAMQEFLTYSFAEPGFGSLVLNMIFLFCFGNAVNARLGHIAYSCLYLLLGTVAGLIWLSLGTGAALLGSAGAVMGVTGFFLVLYPRNDVRVFYLGRAGGLQTFSIASYWMVAISMFIDLIAVLSGMDAGLPYACLIGGEISGFFLACGLLRAGIVPVAREEQNVLELVGLQPRLNATTSAAKADGWEFKPMTKGDLSRGLAAQSRRCPRTKRGPA